MTRVEELQLVRATPAQAIALLLDPSRMHDWSAPDVTVRAEGRGGQLVPGDRFRVEAIAGPSFEYQLEAVTGREVVLRFTGPWNGEERWSFMADGDDTIIRRTYTVEDPGGLAGLAWRTIGAPLVMAHFKLELARFRSLVERMPRVRAEIDAGAARRPAVDAGEGTGRDAPESTGSRHGFRIDDG